jgi:hypothetical protein
MIPEITGFPGRIVPQVQIGIPGRIIVIDLRPVQGDGGTLINELALIA